MKRWGSCILHVYTIFYRSWMCFRISGGTIKATHRRCISDMDIRSLPQEQQIHAVHGGLGRVSAALPKNVTATTPSDAAVGGKTP